MPSFAVEGFKKKILLQENSTFKSQLQPKIFYKAKRPRLGQSYAKIA